MANNFAGESMTRVHKQAGAINVEPVRLFYIRVKLTIPPQVRTNAEALNSIVTPLSLILGCSYPTLIYMFIQQRRLKF